MKLPVGLTEATGDGADSSTSLFFVSAIEASLSAKDKQGWPGFLVPPTISNFAFARFVGRH